MALADETGIKLRVRLHIDAAAALGILESQGVRRVRHLDIGVLWLQEHQLRRVLETTTVLGIEKPSRFDDEAPRPKDRQSIYVRSRS